MKPQDLKLLELLDFKPEEGIISFKNRRMLIYDADALGLLRQELINALGTDRAYGILARFGFAMGYQDSHTSQELFRWESEQECWASGPILHTLEGKVQALPVKVEFDKSGGRFYAEVIWNNSYESEQHLRHIGLSQVPVCWTLAGYGSGFSTACFGEEVYFLEQECVARGDKRCFVIGKTARDWGEELTPYLKYFKGESLRKELDELRQILQEKEQELARQRREMLKLKKTLAEQIVAKDFIYRSKEMEQVLELVSRVAPVDTSVLIVGESGTGKELIARMIHQKSKRSKGPFVAINCGALTETLLESELFGYVKGAFTGAISDKKGLFEEANKGTIFLDEITETSPALQVKLLRVLQEREIRRVGENKPIKVDVRVIAATNRNTQEMVEKGEFRKDLFFRLNVVTVAVPPLRERREDIVPLARYFLEKYSKTLQKKITAITPEAIELMLEYDWPGNIRELENVIERAVVLTSGSKVEAGDLPSELREKRHVLKALFSDSDLSLAEFEKQYILWALEKNGGNQLKTARQLGVSYSTLWRKLKRYGLRAK